MTPTLIHQEHRRPPGRHDTAPPARARDWAEIQERMFVPLYDAVYRRLGVGPGTRLLGLGCGSGLALLRAASLGADVTGADTDADRLRLARERLLPEPEWGGRRWPARLVSSAVPDAAGAPYTLITAFSGPPDPAVLRRAARLAAPGSPVVLAGCGDPGQCTATVTHRLDTPTREPGPADGRARAARCGAEDGTPPRGEGQETTGPVGSAAALEDVAARAGLRHRETAEVNCPFGYPGLDGAVRGLLATGNFDAAVRVAGAEQVVRELTEALHPYVGRDGAVWLPSPLPYVIAEV
ncbi:SAM-dependent methyltransferase [Streptomyces otsuchiensis]|uniref:SAM-dependent methyltransferase n=1 Tax=Streptomyces otsuchiensis TaxID=2681388 RepID=UPI001030E0F0|nr:SAM-dependent methyltransferase [Streptomyces otsuchiensis]